MFEWIWNDKLNCYCARHNSTIRADKNGDVFGGGGGDIPQAPTQPSTAEGVKAWADTMPQVYETQMKYAPQQAAQQVALAQQYAQPMGQAMLAAQSGMYPQTTALQENLAGVATQGMQSQVPDWQREQYLSDVNANLGSNVGSGIGADYVSRGLLQQQQDWQRYYQNLGLSVTGRQPLAQASTPATSDYMSNFTPSGVLGNQQQGYSTMANIYGSQLNAQATQNAAMMNMFGQIGGGAMGGLGTWAASSIRYKKNIKLWA